MNTADASVVKYKSLIQKKNIVLVEGDDDVAFYSALVKFVAREEHIQIESAGGIGDKMFGAFENFTTAAEFDQVQSITIVRDADSEPQNTIAAIQGYFRRVGLEIPNVPLVLTEANPRTGFIVMPALTRGTLETVLLDAYPDEQFRECARHFVAQVDGHDALQAGMQDFSFDDQEKRRLFPLLAVGRRNPTRIQPKIQARHAMGSGLWDWGNVEFRPYREYIQRLP